MRKRLNIKAAGILLGGVILFAVGVHFLHGFQVRNNAEILLAQADRAQDEGRLSDAANYLGRYLALAPTRTEARCKYALMLADKKVAKTPKAMMRAYFALSRAIQLAPDRDDVRRRLVAVAMDPWLQRFNDAAAHLDKLPPEGELLGLRARCLEESTRFNEARDYYEKAVAAAPAVLDNYVRLAALLREHGVAVRRAKDENLDALADAQLKAMRDVNPKNYEAYLIRARYLRQKPISPAERDKADAEIKSDIEAARQLAPEQVDVILAIADLERERRGSKGIEVARGMLRAGISRHRDDWRLVQALAQLEMQSGQLNAAMKCLRDGLDRMPGQLDLLWNYTHLLIQQQQSAAKAIDKAIDDLGAAGMPAAELDYLRARILCRQEKWLGAARMLERVYPLFLRGYDERKNWFSLNLALECNFLLGACYEQLGDPYRAAAAYDRVVAREPRSVAGRLGLARMKWALGQLDVAEKEYRLAVNQWNVPAAAWVELAQLIIARNLISEHPDWKAVLGIVSVAEKLPDNQRPPKTTLELLRAEAHAALQDYAAARNGLEAATDDKNSRPVEVWIGLAGLELRRGKADSALGILDEAAKKVGDRVELRVARARLVARHPGSETRQILTRLGQNINGYTEEQRLRLFRALAEAYGQLGAYDEASQLWQRVAVHRPNDLFSRFTLFELALARGRQQAMEDQVRDLQNIEGEPEGTLWRYCRACQWIWQAEKGDRKHLGEATQLLKIVADHRPGWARVPLAQARIDDLQGKSEAAVANYQLAVLLGEQRVAVIQQLVRVLTDRGHHVAAEGMIRKLRARSPSLLNGLERPAADIAFVNGEIEQAVKLAFKAVPHDSKDYRDHIWLARLLWAAGKHVEAEDSLRRALAMADGVAETWVALVQHLVRVEHKQEAAEVVRQAEAKLTRDESLVDLAQCYELIGDTESAKRCYDKALVAQPSDARTLYATAIYCLRTNRAAEAQQHFERIIQSKSSPTRELISARRMLALLVGSGGDPERCRAALAMLDVGHDDTAAPPAAGDALADQRARVVILANQPSARKRREAIVILEQMRSKQLLVPEERFLLARLYEAIGEWTKTRTQMAVLLTAVESRRERAANGKDRQTLQSAYARYLAYYALQLVRRGEVAEAQTWQVKLEQLQPNAWPSVEVKARILGKQGKSALAVPLLRKAVDADAKLTLAVAQVLEDVGQGGAAQEMFEKYAADTKEPQRVLVLAMYLARQNRPVEALDLCERAWKTCSAVTVASTSVAVVYLAKSGPAHCDQVARKIETAIAAHADQSNLLVDLAAVRRLQGRSEDAVQLLRQVIARDKSDAMVRNNIAWLLALQGRPDEALTEIKAAMVLRGEQASLLDTRAVAYIAKGKYTLAVADLQEAVAEGPSPSRYFHLAQAHMGTGNYAAARDALAHGKSLGLTESTVDVLERTAYHQLLSKVDRR